MCVVILVVVISVAGLLFAIVVSGMFEGSIVKNCTNCSNSGPLTRISWHYTPNAILALGRKCLLKNRPWGVLHDVHLCAKCCAKVWSPAIEDRVCKIIKGDS